MNHPTKNSHALPLHSSTGIAVHVHALRHVLPYRVGAVKRLGFLPTFLILGLAVQPGRAEDLHPMTLLTHVNWKERYDALDMMKNNLSNWETHPPFVSLLLTLLTQDPSFIVRRHILDWLRGSSIPIERMEDALVKTLKDPIARTRGWAAMTLGRSRNTKMLKPLANLLGDRDRTTQGMAASALGAFEHEEAVPYLMHALEFPLEEVPAEAAKSMALRGAPMIPVFDRIFKESSLRGALTMARAIGQVSDLSVRPWLFQQAGHALPRQRHLAMEGLSETPDPDPAVLSTLTQAAGDPDPRVRAAAVRGVGRKGNVQSLALLTLAASDTIADVRKEAFLAMGALNLTLTLPMLRGAFQQDPVPVVRNAALRGIGLLDHPDAVVFLLDLLPASPDLSAILTMLLTRPEHTLSSVCALLQHSDAGLRAHAALALHRMFLTERFPPHLLESWVTEMDHFLKEASSGQIQMRRLLIPDLQRAGPKALPLLLREFRRQPDDQKVILETVMDVLRFHPDLFAWAGVSSTLQSETSAFLMEALSYPADSWVRRRVVAALPLFTWLNVAEAATHVERTLARDDDPAGRAAAAKALGVFRQPSSKTVLRQALQDPPPEVRREAENVLEALEGIPLPANLKRRQP